MLRVHLNSKGSLLILCISAVLCSPPPAIALSTVIRQTTPRVPSATATYQCNVGYSAAVKGNVSANVIGVNEFTVRCSASGQWYPLPDIYVCKGE